MIYSQNNEQILVEKYFGNFKGTLLDIGANDGITLSNSYALLLTGWQGALVEPSPKAFELLIKLHKERHQVHCYNLAISDKTGKMPFYESGKHLSDKDVALLSSLKEEETKHWDKTEFTKIEVDAFKFDLFMDLCVYQKFDYITIDAEGMDFEILSQMDLNQLGCRCLIVEWNGKAFNAYYDFAKASGLHLVHQNFENLIFVK